MTTAPENPLPAAPESEEATYRIGVISDTHGFLHPRVFEHFARVNLILHAGDIGEGTILEELETLAPVQAVSGNVDGPPEGRRPLARQLTTVAGKIAMTHGHLPAASAHRLETMEHFFRDFAPRIIVYGHTHIAKIEPRDGVTFFNPGAAGKSQVGGRAASVGMITLDTDHITPLFNHLPLD